MSYSPVVLLAPYTHGLPHTSFQVGARTLRPKIHKHLPTYLEEFPDVTGPPSVWAGPPPEPIDWAAVIKEATANQDVPEVRSHGSTAP